MPRKFVQLTPIVGERADMEFYAVAEDGTAWYGRLGNPLDGDHIHWEQVTPLPETSS